MASRLEAPLWLAAQWWMLAVESQYAVWLRAMKLCVGGRNQDCQSAIVRLLDRTMPVGIVRDYRSAVRANVLRLSSA